jgi:transcriptional regulator with XRE-family HTH domain
MMFTIIPDIATLSSDKKTNSGFICKDKPAILIGMKTSGENEKVFLGKRIRALRKVKGWTQEELGKQADISYKFLGEIERGVQNASFSILVKIAHALAVELPALFRFESQGISRKEMESRIQNIIKALPDDELGRILTMFKALYPIQ